MRGRMSTKNNRGFSLLELVIAGAMLSLITAGGVCMLALAARVGKSEGELRELEREAAVVSELFTELVQEAEILKLREDTEEFLLISGTESDGERIEPVSWLRWEKQSGELYVKNRGSGEEMLAGSCVAELAVTKESGRYVAYFLVFRGRGAEVSIHSGAVPRNSDTVFELWDPALSP